MKKNPHLPKVSNTLKSVVKPSELIDVIEMTPLTLADRRIYNLLLGNAWNDIFTKESHSINHIDLEKYVNSKNQNILVSLRRLMTAIVQVHIPKNKNGREATRQIALLSENETEKKGTITYSFPPQLIKLLKDSKTFARLSTEVMFKFSSKYALALYEFTEKRKNLKHISYEILDLIALRGLLGIPDKSLKTFGHFNDKAFKPALKEINFYSDCELKAEYIKTGRAVTHIKLSWKIKDFGGLIGAVEELERSKVGAKARMEGTIENITGFSSQSQEPQALTATTYAEAQAIIKIAGNNWSLADIEKQFFEFLSKKDESIKDINKCFIGFVKKKVATLP